MTDRNRCVSCAREQRAFFLFFWWLICNSLDPKKNTKRAKWSQNSGLFLLCLRPSLLALCWYCTFKQACNFPAWLGKPPPSHADL